MVQLHEEIGFVAKILQGFLFFACIESSIAHLLNGDHTLRLKAFVFRFIDSTIAAFADHLSNTVTATEKIARQKSPRNTTTRCSTSNSSRIIAIRLHGR